MSCPHRVRQESEQFKSGETIPIYACNKHVRCVVSESHRRIVGVESIHVCDGQHDAPVTLRRKEPVGTRLSEILAECGIQKPTCGTCAIWTVQMDAWGVKGCLTNKAAIVDHLWEAASGSSWLDLIRVARHGYLTIDELFNEAIRRAQS